MNDVPPPFVHVVLFHEGAPRVITSYTDRLVACAFAAGFSEGASMFSGMVDVFVLPGDEDDLAFFVKTNRIAPAQIDAMHALIAASIKEVP